MGMVTYANGFRLAVDAMNDVLLPFTWIFCGTGGRIDLVQQGDWEIEYWARDKDLSYLTEPTITVRDFYEGLGSSPMVAQEPPALPAFDTTAAVARGYSELISCMETGAQSSRRGGRPDGPRDHRRLPHFRGERWQGGFPPNREGRPRVQAQDSLAGCGRLGSAEGRSPFAGSLRVSLRHNPLTPFLAGRA